MRKIAACLNAREQRRLTLCSVDIMFKGLKIKGKNGEIKVVPTIAGPGTNAKKHRLTAAKRSSILAWFPGSPFQQLDTSYDFTGCLYWIRVNDPSAGSPTETLLRLLLPLNATVWSSSRYQSSVTR